MQRAGGPPPPGETSMTPGCPVDQRSCAGRCRRRPPRRRHGPAAEPREQRGPVQRRAEREAQGQAAVGRQPVGLAPPGPQLLGGRPERVLHGPVELADAAEAGGEGDVGERSGRCRPGAGGRSGPGGSGPTWSGVAPTCSANSRRRCRALTPRRAGQVGLGVLVEVAVDDQAHGPAHQLRARRPRPRGPTCGTGRHWKQARSPAASAAAADRWTGYVLGERAAPTARSAVDAGRADPGVPDGAHGSSPDGSSPCRPTRPADRLRRSLLMGTSSPLQDADSGRIRTPGKPMNRE